MDEQEDRYPQYYEDLQSAIDNLYEWHRSKGDTRQEAEKRINDDVAMALESTIDSSDYPK